LGDSPYSQRKTGLLRRCFFFLICFASLLDAETNFFPIPSDISPNESYSEDSLYQTWNNQIKSWRKQGWVRPEHSVVVFPDSFPWVFATLSRTDPQPSVFWRVVRSILVCPRLPCSAEELELRWNARTTAAIFQNTMSRLSSENRIGIVAGCLVLPSPLIRENILTIRNEGLEKHCYFFSRDGLIAEIPTHPKKSLGTNFGKIARLEENRYQVWILPKNESFSLSKEGLRPLETHD